MSRELLALEDGVTAIQREETLCRRRYALRDLDDEA